ncbi:hypothetical protein Dda_4243 [Drechslerella dactyloides]|uniref:Uncharacterized protein n=1 Tax=Drechslerella dactyloides TaxID=74499 RepID=A0AAD6IZD7_DREDA|nr:hypothetical protein Dda_4243 [Drechslerella dactyloides]
MDLNHTATPPHGWLLGSAVPASDGFLASERIADSRSSESAMHDLDEGGGRGVVWPYHGVATPIKRRGLQGGTTRFKIDSGEMIAQTANGLLVDTRIAATDISHQYWVVQLYLTKQLMSHNIASRIAVDRSVIFLFELERERNNVTNIHAPSVSATLI